MTKKVLLIAGVLLAAGSVAAISSPYFRNAHMRLGQLLAEFGDDPHRYRDGKARRNYAATSPITRASGKKKAVMARFVHNDRLVDALNAQAFAALNASPGARAYYDELRARGIEHNDALRRLANRLVGILHGCLKTRTLYDEATAWSHRENKLAA